MQSLEEIYYFNQLDARWDEDELRVHLKFPVIYRYDEQDLNWWNEKPIVLSKPVQYRADDNFIDTDESYQYSDILSYGHEIIIREPVRNALFPFLHLQPSMQFLPSYIVKTNGDFDEGWYSLHIPQVLDFWDRDQSKFLIVDGKQRDKLETVFLDEKKILSIPEEDRMIIRLEIPGKELYLFHERVVDIFKAMKAKGTLFAPLSQYTRTLRWMRNNIDELNQEYPW